MSIHSVRSQDEVIRQTFFVSLVAALLLITAHRLPAPILEVPGSPTPAPSARPKPKLSASPSKVAKNAFGMIEGKYIGHLRKEEYVAKSNMKLSTGALTWSHYFIIQGKRFKFFRITKRQPTRAGRARGWTRLTYTMRWEGVIYPDGSGAYLFVPNSVEVLERTPKEIPDSVTSLEENRKALGAMRWTLYFDAARLVQVSDGETWSLER